MQENGTRLGWSYLFGTTWLRVFLWNIVWRGADSANPYRRCRYYTLYFMGKTSRKHGRRLTDYIRKLRVSFKLSVNQEKSVVILLGYL